MASNLLECSICLSAFDNPHILPGCGHTFCLSCIQQIPKTSVGVFHGLHATTDSTCPLCRMRFSSRHVLPNFALQHVVGEGRPQEAAGRGGGAGLDVQRGRGHADVGAIYRKAGVPPQLAQVLAEEDESIALRVYILDNSGSMDMPDGAIVEQGAAYARPAKRWDELKHMAMEHAEWNAKLGVPSEFVLLNSSNPGNPVDGKDLVRIDGQRGSTEKQLSSLRTLLNQNYPGGGTPLTERLHTLTRRLHQSAPELRDKGRKLMLILVTDGVPNGSRSAFAGAIRVLAQEHPVHVVVRLCTNDDSVSEFYDEVDKELELSLDILDDFQGESKSIYTYNPWFTYTQILHTVREAGSLSKLLDLVDERSLTPMEVGLCAQLVLRPEGQTKYPWQPEKLLEAVERDLAAAAPVMCIRRRGMFPPFDITKLRAAVLPSRYSLTGQVATAVGLGGVAEAWYEGRTLLDAFQHPKVTAPAAAAAASAAPAGPAAPGRCTGCTRTTDGTFAHCCRTCERSGGKEHGPTCERRNGPVLCQPAGEVLQIGEVPPGVCFLCARATDGTFPHCCRTCQQSGGTRHGPACESKHVASGYPMVAGKGKGKDKGEGEGKGKEKGKGKGGTNGRGNEAGKGGYNASEVAQGKGMNASDAANSNQAMNAGYQGSL